MTDRTGTTQIYGTAHAMHDNSLGLLHDHIPVSLCIGWRHLQVKLVLLREQEHLSIHDEYMMGGFTECPSPMAQCAPKLKNLDGRVAGNGDTACSKAFLAWRG